MSDNIMFRQRPIEGSTALCAMLGDPASHSLASVYFSEILEVIGADCVYLCFDVNPVQLENAIIGCRAMNIRGMVITAPHKVAVMRCLDEIDPAAEKIGSVNVVVNRNGRLIGYNMDAVGFMLPLKDIDLKGKKVLMLGAGGAARACAFGICSAGAGLTILNRNPEDAKALAERLAQYTDSNVNWDTLTPENIAREIADADILLQTTTVGFAEQFGETLVPEELLHSGLYVYDILVPESRLVLEAKAKGLETMSGIYVPVGMSQMLLEALTGEKPPENIIEIMRQAVLKAMAREAKA